MADAEQDNIFQVIRREIVLLVVIAISAIPLYLFTRKMAEMNRHRNTRVAVDLYRRAERQLAAHEPDAAIETLRDAVTNDRQNPRYAFALAQALVASHHDAEARLALMRLRDAKPEDAAINLELGRLAARHHDLEEAVRYYHHALYGRWSGENISEQRRKVRIELIRLLLNRGERSRALAELLILSEEAPHHAPAHIELARLFVEAQDLPRAVQHFITAVGIAPHDFDALRGAGVTAFDLGDYRTAARFLERAAGERPGAADVAELLGTSRLVESNDPLAPHLTRREQLRRITADLDQAVQRVRDCANRESAAGVFRPTALDKMAGDAVATRKAMTDANLRENPDLLLNAADVAFAIEEVTSATCGPPTGLDHAILLMAKRHEREAS